MGISMMKIVMIKMIRSISAVELCDALDNNCDGQVMKVFCLHFSRQWRWWFWSPDITERAVNLLLDLSGRYGLQWWRSLHFQFFRSLWRKDNDCAVWLTMAWTKYGFRRRWWWIRTSRAAILWYGRGLVAQGGDCNDSNPVSIPMQKLMISIMIVMVTSMRKSVQFSMQMSMGMALAMQKSNSPLQSGRGDGR